jgi:DNA-binding CsgD family transcriptional regulator
MLEAASRLAVWDGVVCALRASPDLLRHAVGIERFRAELGQVLIRSNEVKMAKAFGVVTRASGAHGILSSRERQVLELVAQGHTNASIAKLLSISPGTVKSHLDHSFGKLGVGNRAAAVTRYAEIEKAASDDAAGS